MTKAWRVTLQNKAAECCYTGEASTRFDALMVAMSKASEQFLTYHVADNRRSWWLDGWHGCLESPMYRGASYVSHEPYHGLTVSLRRVGD